MADDDDDVFASDAEPSTPVERTPRCSLASGGDAKPSGKPVSGRVEVDRTDSMAVSNAFE